MDDVTARLPGESARRAGVTAVAFDRVSIVLGERTVLSDVGFEIREGEFIGMLGANGAGKTTLMRAILGLVRLSAGAIHAFGRPVTRGNPAVGYLPQNRST